MATITATSTLEDVAAIISSSLDRAGIAATLSGGAAVSIYTNNAYQSKDLDFVTAALVADISPVLSELGFIHAGVPRLSQFLHPKIEWFVEFPPSPISLNDAHPREQAILVAANNKIDLDELQVWFENEGESDAEFDRFRAAVRRQWICANQVEKSPNQQRDYSPICRS